MSGTAAQRETDPNGQLTEPVLRARARPQRAAGNATRRRLLDAGRQVFANDGLAGSSVQAILDVAEVSPPALYHHFGSKSALFVAVAEEVYERFIGALRASTAGAEDSHSAVQAAIGAAAQLHRDDPGLAAIAIEVQIEARRSAQLRHELTPALGAFRAFAEELALRDTGEPPAVDLRSRTLAIVALLNGLSSLAVTLQDPAEFAMAAAALGSLVSPGGTATGGVGPGATLTVAAVNGSDHTQLRAHRGR